MRKSLHEFTKQAWHVLEPATPFVDGWAIGAINEHLQAITSGEIKRLVITVPPGCMKSLSTCVFWPAWEWGAANLSHHRIIGTSHSMPFSLRDNLKMKRLITSEWYQSFWGDTVTLTKDQKQKTKFENTNGGFRECAAFTSLTGLRGHRLIIDDAMTVDDSKSKIIRESIESTFRDSVQTRLIDPKKSAIVLIMQRLCEKDPAGIAIHEMGWESLMLPMEFEPSRKCFTSIGFQDPRENEGELLFPERFPREVVVQYKKSMTKKAVAAQLQQRPAPEEGTIIKEEYLKYYQEKPQFKFILQSWDTAFKTGQDNDYSVCTTWGVGELGYYLIHRFKDKLEFPQLVEELKNCFILHNPNQVIIEDKASGQSLIQSIRKFTNIPIKAIRIDKDKEARANAVTPYFEAGRIFLPANAPWLQDYVNELTLFPSGEHDDQVDSTVQAIAHLTILMPKTLEFTHSNYFGR